MIQSPTREIVAACGLTALEYHDVVSSTMDVAHELAQRGAAAGTAVLASRQEQGRGRGGHVWQSEPDAGLWLTLIERPVDVRALDVLSLRIGLELADALTPLTDGVVQLKWPNDLYVREPARDHTRDNARDDAREDTRDPLQERKLAGILIEVRWRDGRPEWVAIGVGINRRVPEHFQRAAHVRSDVSRDVLLLAAVPALRRAAAVTGPLTDAECAAWARRDLARGRFVSAPVAGQVEGISHHGAVLIRDSAGVLHASHSGSLVFV